MTIAIAEESSVCVPNLQPLWHRKAPSSLVERSPAADPYGGWKAWQDHLHRRRKPVPPPFTKKTKSPLLWGWPREWERTTIQEAIDSPTLLAEILIGDEPAATPDLTLALEMVALAYSMPKLAGELPAETWWPLLERLHEMAVEAQARRVDWPADPRDVLRHQLLAGELPIALGYLFPEVRAMRALLKNARESLTEAISELTDGQGLPDARLLPVLGPLFACWTRARWLGARLNRGPWSREADLQFQWLVRHAIRLADKGGRFLLTGHTHLREGEAPAEPLVAKDRLGGSLALPSYATPGQADRDWDTKLFEMAIELAGDRGDRAAAADALPRGAMPKGVKYCASDLPDPSLNSDWAGITIMADGWSQSDVRLAVEFAREPMTIELAAGGGPLIAGAWTTDTWCDGKLVKPVGEWEQLCWESGKRFDLLELGLELSDGLRLERQMVFGRDDRVLYLADMIISRDRAARQIRHSFGLPLANGARWQPEADTRDGLLLHGKARTAVFPLALSEWRSDPRGGTIEHDDRRLVLTQEANGSTICCPLLLDLNNKRAAKPRTWRQLTVGENLEVVPRDVAVGYRAQSGRDQWLFYRSLGPAGNRTILGQNIAGEFCAGRFLTSGELKEWIEIEAV